MAIAQVFILISNQILRNFTNAKVGTFHLACTALFIMTFTWLVFTQNGTRVVINYINTLPNIKIENFSGVLAHSLKAENVILNQDGIRLSLAQTAIDWDLNAILHKKIE